MNIIRLNSIGEPFAKSGQATPPSGGGTEASSMEYLDVSGLDVTNPDSKYNALLGYSMLAKANLSGNLACLPSAAAIQMLEMVTISSVAIDFNLQLNAFMDSLKTIKEHLLSLYFTEAELAAIPRITKEQFYAL